MPSLPFKISVLVFIKDKEQRLLLLKRKKTPNKGLWSPVGGKLEMAKGESPFECAIREVSEETGMSIKTKDLHLFGMISEKAYEGSGHWLMFLFNCKSTVRNLPPSINEGSFQFFTRDEVNGIPIPQTDRQGLWPLYDKYANRFVVMRADCSAEQELEIVVEEVI